MLKDIYGGYFNDDYGSHDNNYDTNDGSSMYGWTFKLLKN